MSSRLADFRPKFVREPLSDKLIYDEARETQVTASSRDHGSSIGGPSNDGSGGGANVGSGRRSSAEKELSAIKFIDGAQFTRELLQKKDDIAFIRVPQTVTRDDLNRDLLNAKEKKRKADALGEDASRPAKRHQNKAGAVTNAEEITVKHFEASDLEQPIISKSFRHSLHRTSQLTFPPQSISPLASLCPKTSNGIAIHEPIQAEARLLFSTPTRTPPSTSLSKRSARSILEPASWTIT
jgi:hypothetical protein